MPHETAQPMTKEMDQCIRACLECGRICAETVNHCLQLGGEHAGPDHMRRLLDCARACELSAELMSRGSDMAGKTCELCAQFCDLCAEDCERMADGDQTMKRCAEQCRRCAEACRTMAA